MAGRELIRELHEASCRRLAIELLAFADDLRTAENAARGAFAAAYRNGRAIEAAASPYDELRQQAIEACGRPAAREGPFAILRRRPTEQATLPAAADPRLSAEANATLTAVVALPPAEREAVVLRYLVGLSDTEVATAVSAPLETVNARLAIAATALRAGLGPDGRRYRERLDDLAIDLRHAIGMPSFGEVVATAARHRRRMLASVVAAAALVSAGVVVSVSRSPEPATTSADTAAIRNALQAPGTTMYAAVRNADGLWASFWYCRSCVVERSFALLSRDGFMHALVVPLFTDGQGDAWAAPTGDFVVSSGINGVTQVVAPDGSVRNVGGLTSAPPMPAGPDDLVVTSYGVGPPNVAMVIDPRSLRQWPLSVSDFGDTGAVTIVESHPDGDLWGFHLYAARAGMVHSADGGRTWSGFLFPSVHAHGQTRAAASPFGQPLVSASGTIAFLSLPAGRPNPNHPELLLSSDGGDTWVRRGAARDVRGRPVEVHGAALATDGSVVVTGVDAGGVPRVWLGSEPGVAGYRALRPVLQESVELVVPPLDSTGALWATAPQAIWESDDSGRTWYLLISHQTWQNIEVVGE